MFLLSSLLRALSMRDSSKSSPNSAARLASTSWLLSSASDEASCPVALFLSFAAASSSLLLLLLLPLSPVPRNALASADQLDRSSSMLVSSSRSSCCSASDRSSWS